jgi:hypothetical protein
MCANKNPVGAVERWNANLLDVSEARVSQTFIDVARPEVRHLACPMLGKQLVATKVLSPRLRSSVTEVGLTDAPPVTRLGVRPTQIGQAPTVEVIDQSLEFFVVSSPHARDSKGTSQLRMDTGWIPRRITSEAAREKRDVNS